MPMRRWSIRMMCLKSKVGEVYTTVPDLDYTMCASHCHILAWHGNSPFVTAWLVFLSGPHRKRTNDWLLNQSVVNSCLQSHQLQCTTRLVSRCTFRVGEFRSTAAVIISYIIWSETRQSEEIVVEEAWMELTFLVVGPLSHNQYSIFLYNSSASSHQPQEFPDGQ